MPLAGQRDRFLDPLIIINRTQNSAVMICLYAILI